METLTLKDVTKVDATGKLLLDRINLTVERSEVISFIGPEKSGKSCLLEAISGNIGINSGEIYYGSTLINSKAGNRKIADILTPKYSPRSAVCGIFKRKPHAKKVIPERLEVIAKKTGINRDTLTGPMETRLSKGEMQKLELMRYLLAENNLFLLDDPFIGFDLLTRKKLREILKELLAEFRVTTALVTPFIEEAFYLANRVVIMREGRIEQAGGKEILEAPANEFVRGYISG